MFPEKREIFEKFEEVVFHVSCRQMVLLDCDSIDGDLVSGITCACNGDANYSVSGRGNVKNDRSSSFGE